MIEQITGMLTNPKVKIIEPVIAKGCPKKEDFEALDNLANEILEKHKEYNIFKEG